MEQRITGRDSYGLRVGQGRCVGPQIPVAVFIHCVSDVDIVKIISVVKLEFLSHEIIIQQHRRMCVVNPPNGASDRSRDKMSCTGLIRITFTSESAFYYTELKRHM